MKNDQNLSTTWSTNSDLPHRSGQGCNFSLTECQELPRDVFPQKLSHLHGPNFLGVDVLLVIRDACASVSERIHSSSSNCFEVGSFSFLRNISCVLREKKRHRNSQTHKHSTPSVAGVSSNNSNNIESSTSTLPAHIAVCASTRLLSSSDQCASAAPHGKLPCGAALAHWRARGPRRAPFFFFGRTASELLGPLTQA